MRASVNMRNISITTTRISQALAARTKSGRWRHTYTTQVVIRAVYDAFYELMLANVRATIRPSQNT